MVKGVSRRIVVVHAPEQKVFEEAIFILRDDAKGYTAENVVEQACEVASRYLHETRDGRLRRLGLPLLCGSVGAGLCGIVWLLTALL